MRYIAALLVLLSSVVTAQPTPYVYRPVPSDAIIVTPKFLPSQFKPSWVKNTTSEEILCLAKNIYFEAKGEGHKGQIAVALVTINRVKSKRFPNTICEVVWQTKRHPLTRKYVPQFSWTLDGKSDTPRERVWNPIVSLSINILANGSLNNVTDFTHGSTHYHANYVYPYWSNILEHTITVGNHIFYK